MPDLHHGAAEGARCNCLTCKTHREAHYAALRSPDRSVLDVQRVDALSGVVPRAKVSVSNSDIGVRLSGPAALNALRISSSLRRYLGGMNVYDAQRLPLRQEHRRHFAAHPCMVLETRSSEFVKPESLFIEPSPDRARL